MKVDQIERELAKKPQIDLGTVHHFSAGTYAKEMHLPKGHQAISHVHSYDHISILAQGMARVETDTEGKVYTAPACITIKAGVKHSITAIEDVTWFCVHATDEPKAADDVPLVPVNPPIKLLARGVNVEPLRWLLRSNPQLWNQHTLRTEGEDSPHHGLDDIWVRYASSGNENNSSEFAWYEAADILALRPLVAHLMRETEGTELGGVLITRIPPGKTCMPHIDKGWHAERYQKFAVQIDSAPGQLFQFHGHQIETVPGDVFWFDNSYEHWVTNPTPHERITLIVCIKTDKEY